ncbi:TetR/AcrR family transcriptional regulator [Henriciella sp.]|uniref:TetR/AcrR family transcriptional regulator n=1 Tax=Henriciella sp. TaxID=1968823 RepID=UPI00262429FD|nr:TetR family transcriptional regulator [Henriciella sp.]
MPARERLLRTVLSLIVRHGAERVTHRLVAEAAELSPGTLTYHFADRDGMIREAFRLYMHDYQCGLDDALAARPLSSPGEIARFLTTLTTLDPSDAELAVLEYELVSLAQRDTEIGDSVRLWAACLPDAVTAALQAHGQANAEEMARVLIAICRGVEAEVLSRKARIFPDELERRLLRIMQTGC